MFVNWYLEHNSRNRGTSLQGLWWLKTLPLQESIPLWYKLKFCLLGYRKPIIPLHKIEGKPTLEVQRGAWRSVSLHFMFCVSLSSLPTKCEVDAYVILVDNNSSRSLQSMEEQLACVSRLFERLPQELVPHILNVYLWGSRYCSSRN